MSERAFPLIVLTALLAVAGCAQPEERGETITAAAAVAEVPITTSSQAALDHFMTGQRLADAGRALEARAAFLQAVQEDPQFARGYLEVANNANSTTEFKEYMDKALANVAGASEGERILIDINMAFFDNNVEGALALAQKLVQEYPTSPRSWLSLAGVYGALDRNEEAREKMKKALQLDPTLTVAHSNVGFSYLFTEPKDFDAAARHFQHVIDLTPREPQAHVNLGDAYRGSQNLEGARAAYARAADLDPSNEKAVYSIALLKKGHVNSFLGAYEEARQDYDRALTVAKPEQKSLYANYKTFTWVHAGQPQVAIRELQKIADTAAEVTPADQVNGAKAFALTNLAQIAMHHGMHDVAARAISQRNQFVMEDARKTAREDFIRGQQAGNVYWEGQAAARRGDFETALMKAEENKRLLEKDANPRKLEPYHDLLGLVALLQGKHQEAIGHYEQANPNNIYTKFHLGLTHEGAGDLAAAREVFRYVFENNFNSVGYALVRKEAQSKMAQRVSVTN